MAILIAQIAKLIAEMAKLIAGSAKLIAGFHPKNAQKSKIDLHRVPKTKKTLKNSGGYFRNFHHRGCYKLR